MNLEIRGTLTVVDEVRRQAGQTVEPAARKVVATLVMRNPFAGQFVQDLSPLYALGAEAGETLVRVALEALGTDSSKVMGYGKGAIVGLRGELEHAAALLHPAFGAPVRRALGGGKAIIMGTKIVGAAGTRLIIPVGNKDDIWQFDNLDSAELSCSDAPADDEIVVALCLAASNRALSRVKAIQ